ncbi:phosphoribosyl-ATP diphosphatase [Variovorax sp. PCZ-1]|uniref:phosphoribosyl-ATP diphosphatase n=1 Tax=Variovorax sp. PCZ-1 TaxID=2835533 RepID=UPI001BCB401C|nr:phosphoribosyl-ATP diphosphatase [Variovorax sp. PCZ-1]MBS7808844.1 phosphoribosyl-ATP diphosphatase [Variovorax sp. PCZ-1]
MTSNDSLDKLAQVLESRKGGDPETSYVARLFSKAPDAFLKKIGEEATEVVLACKDASHGGDKQKIVSETADLWFHSLVALSHYGLTPRDVLAELERRVGLSGLDEKAARKALGRDTEDRQK